MVESSQKINESALNSPSRSTSGARGWVDSRESNPKSRESTHESNAESWYERNEKAGNFLLNLTIWLVRILPRFALNIAVIFVTAIYYALSKKERKNLAKFYTLAQHYCKENALQDSLRDSAKIALNKPNIYLNFYHFGWAICDKVAAWIGKIQYKDISVKNISFLNDELCSGKKGQILLMSHFGNIEVARALSHRFHNLRITTFVYQKNTEKFLQMIDKISGRKIDRIYVDEIDIKRLLDLREIIENGGHIGIMGDRVALSHKRNLEMKFLGKKCYFPLGAFIIAKLLGTKISMMWCEKIDGKYRVELENISESSDDFVPNVRESAHKNKRDRFANLKPLLQKYVDSLEFHALNNPTQWFSFYDFWESPRENFHNLGDLDSQDLGANLNRKNTRNLH